MTNIVKENVRLFFQFYGTFSSLLRCYFFPAVILQVPPLSSSLFIMVTTVL